jgi:hypothetical protein
MLGRWQGTVVVMEIATYMYSQDETLDFVTTFRHSSHALTRFRQKILLNSISVVKIKSNEIVCTKQII